MTTPGQDALYAGEAAAQPQAQAPPPAQGPPGCSFVDFIPESTGSSGAFSVPVYPKFRSVLHVRVNEDVRTKSTYVTFAKFDPHFTKSLNASKCKRVNSKYFHEFLLNTFAHLVM